MLTGSHAGPDISRGLFQYAVSHTCEPAGMVAVNSTSKSVRVDSPSVFHAPMSAGGAAPTKLHTEAPRTPSGFARRSESADRSRIVTVRPSTRTISITGFSVGGLIGDGVASRTGSPRSIRIASVVPGK